MIHNEGNILGMLVLTPKVAGKNCSTRWKRPGTWCAKPAVNGTCFYRTTIPATLPKQEYEANLATLENNYHQFPAKKASGPRQSQRLEEKLTMQPIQRHRREENVCHVSSVLWQHGAGLHRAERQPRDHWRARLNPSRDDRHSSTHAGASRSVCVP